MGVRAIQPSGSCSTYSVRTAGALLVLHRTLDSHPRSVMASLFCFATRVHPPAKSPWRLYAESGVNETLLAGSSMGAR